jgi:hypothetical protein
LKHSDTRTARSDCKRARSGSSLPGSKPDQSARRDADSVKDVLAISTFCTRVSKAEWSDSDTLSLRMTSLTSGSLSKVANVSVQTVASHIVCHHSRQARKHCSCFRGGRWK